MQANDAMRILGSAAAMGLLGGSGALAYNAISKPTLDEYGNTIESNDINPFVAALGGAAIGAVGGGIYGKMNQPIARPARPVQGMASADMNIQNEIDDLRNEIAITRQGIEEYKKTIKVPDFRNMSDDEFKEFYRNKDSYYIPSWNDKKYINTRMGDIAEREHEYAQAVQGVEDLRAASTPIRQIVRANPMKPQNPMSPPGADIVVVPQNPVQQSADELMALQNLAASQGNPANLVIEYFDPSPDVKTFGQDVYSPKGEYLYSQIGQKQFQNPDRLPKSIQQPVRPGQEESITTRQELEADAATRYQRQQAARRDMHVGNWNNSKGNYNTQYPEDNQYNIAGWDLVNPTPGAAQWQREAAIIQAQKKMM